VVMDNSIQREPKSENRSLAPLTDSPWFWAALFSAVALAALFAMHGKYGKRQANIEQKYQARERLKWEEAGSRQKAEGRQEYSQPGETVVPLWPLAVPLAAVVVISVAMLVRGRNNNRKAAK
jgi:hypothetical protein